MGTYTPSFCYETCRILNDPDSGALVVRLTTAAAISSNIYCEQPYSSPDGRRVAIIRSTDFNRNYPFVDLWVADLPAGRIALAQCDVHSQIVNTAWSEYVFYWKSDRCFYRLSLMSLEEERILDRQDLPRVNCGLSISPDLRYLVYGTAVPADSGSGRARFGIVRVDLQTQAWQIVFEHFDMVNPHTQFDPTHGRTILLQQNLNPLTLPDGTVMNLGTGALLLLIDSDGGNPRRLPVGPPLTSPGTGHQAFIPGQQRVVLTTTRSEELPAVGGGSGCGNLLLAGSGDSQALVFNAPEYLFTHVSISRCGRFFVCDAYKELGDPVPLVVGCFASGKYRVLLRDCHGTHGNNQWGHAHAYLTADNRHVIYNCEMAGPPAQVYAITVPAGFMDSLL